MDVSVCVSRNVCEWANGCECESVCVRERDGEGDCRSVCESVNLDAWV
jgi:hypothetical protein